MGSDHFADLQQAFQPGVAITSMGGIAAVALPGVDGPKAAIQRAFEHARVVHFRHRAATVTLQDVETLAGQVGRRVEVGVEGEQALLQRLGAREFFGAEIGGGRGQRANEREGKQQRQGAATFHRVSPECGNRTLAKTPPAEQ